MRSTGVRIAVAIAFVLAWCTPFYFDATTGDWDDLATGSAAEAAFLVVYGGLTLLTGLVVRWPALALPIVIYALPLGVNPEDSDGWTYAWLYAIPAGFLSLPVLLAGALGGTVTQSLLRRRNA
jgi:hypothetical protein